MLPVELEQDTNRLLEDRNLSVHTYDSDTADEIYKDYRPMWKYLKL